LARKRHDSIGNQRGTSARTKNVRRQKSVRRIARHDAREIASSSERSRRWPGSSLSTVLTHEVVAPLVKTVCGVEGCIPIQEAFSTSATGQPVARDTTEGVPIVTLACFARSGGWRSRWRGSKRRQPSQDGGSFVSLPPVLEPVRRCPRHDMGRQRLTMQWSRLLQPMRRGWSVTRRAVRRGPPKCFYGAFV